MNNFNETIQSDITGWRIIQTLKLLVIGSLALLNTGCFLFDDKKEPVEGEIITVLPSASFTVTPTSGKAPLTVDFTDTSTAGTSAINSWMWDFNDGNSSTEQNPQHIYEAAGSYDISLTVTTADGTDTTTMVGAVIVEATDILLKITLVDTRGLPIADATATSEAFGIEAQQYNAFGQLELMMRPSESGGIVRISKDGYVDAILYLNGAQGNITLPVTMVPRPPAFRFEALAGGTFTSKDGAMVSIPVDSLVMPDGSSADGLVDLYITPVDTNDPIEGNAFPGSFSGMPTGLTEQEELFSYGVVEFSFFLNGVELQLREGATAQLELPLYATKTVDGEDLAIGNFIPYWSLDETTGVWVQEGVGTIIENPLAPNGISLSAETTHFTWFNVDINPRSWSTSSVRSGGGGGISFPTQQCLLTVNILGVPVGSFIQYTTNYNVGSAFPFSSKTDLFEYTGEPVQQIIWDGFSFTVTIKHGEEEGAGTTSCEGNTAPIEMNVNVRDSVPEFRQWAPQVEVVFEKSASTGLYEVSSNKVRVGGTFIGADNAEVTSSLLPELIPIPSHQYREIDYQSSDANPVQIQSNLTNDIGTTEDVAQVEYEGSKIPKINYFYAHPESNSSATQMYWEIEGADTARVDFIGLDINGIPQSSVTLTDIDSMALLTAAFIAETGYLILIAENQYGQAQAITEITADACLPGSELPQCFPTN
jgi:PKD repeat protein